MNEESIGRAAGILWKYLSETEKPVSVSALKKKFQKLKSDEVIAALGWLAREGKLSFLTEKRKMLVGLSKQVS